jgi:hypothetical protein
MAPYCRTHERCLAAHWLARAIASAAILALALLCNASPALADGDPASDVLATQPLFLPQDADIPPNKQAQLVGLLQQARRGGFQIRVALISSRTDLGSVAELWLQPQTYARFLGQELSLVYRGPLLVLMPNGFGFNGFVGSGAGMRAALAGVSPAASGQRLAAATLTALQRLAAKAGHPLSIPSATTTQASTSGDAAQWILLAIGGVAIAAAWAVSLRARPPRLRRGTTAST